MKNIFVGNLNFSTSEDALRKLFVAFGPVKRVKIMMDDYTGKSRGFGFVEMANAEDGDKAIAALNGTLLDEHAMTVNAARPKKQQGSLRDQNARARGGVNWAETKFILTSPHPARRAASNATSCSCPVLMS